MHQTIRHYMTAKPRTIAADDSVHRARQIMQAAGIRHLPVVAKKNGEESLVGIVTERDIRLLETCGRAGTDIRVREAMTPDPYVVTTDTSLARVARTMADRKFGSAVVVDEGKVVGIFSAVDALHALADMFEEYFAAPTSDRWGRPVPTRMEP